MKKSGMLKRLEVSKELKYERLFKAKMNMLMQMGQDAAMIAAHDVLQLGAGRAVAFAQAYIKAMNGIAHMVVEDQRDDPEFVYAKEKIDRQIRAIVGEENFVPWEERYSCE